MYYIQYKLNNDKYYHLRICDQYRNNILGEWVKLFWKNGYTVVYNYSDFSEMIITSSNGVFIEKIKGILTR